MGEARATGTVSERGEPRHSSPLGRGKPTPGPRRWRWAAVLLCLTVNAGSGAQEATSVERLTQFKAVFLYNFAGYVTWPEDQPSEALVVEILGESEVELLLRDIAGKRQVNGRPLEVRVAADPRQVGPCHLLYVPAGQADRLGAIGEKVRRQPVLTVTDDPEAAARGDAAISFVIVEGKLKFVINRQVLSEAHLRASSHLLKLAIIAPGGRGP